MTGLLKDLMHDRADHLDAPDLDLDSITAAGARRVRRRRTTLAGGLAAAAVVAGLAIPALLPEDGGGVDQVTDGTDAAPVALSWITGSTLHRVGQPDIDLGAHVRAWVWAGDAVVYTDSDRHVHVWQDGETRSIGTTTAGAPDDAELVADESLVAWIDEQSGLSVHDVASDETWSVMLDQGRTPARVTALDGGTAYATDDRGVLTWVIGAQEGVQVIDADGVVLDAENGTIVRRTKDGRAQVTGPGRSVTFTMDSFANLSPDGTLVVAESNDEGILLDTTTGARIDVDSDHEWSLPYEWLDDGTVAVLAFDGINRADGDSTAYLQSCDTATGECTDPGTEIPATSGAFQLPGGVHFAE
jgi:hypothetical protein